MTPTAWRRTKSEAFLRSDPVERVDPADQFGQLVRVEIAGLVTEVFDGGRVLHLAQVGNGPVDAGGKPRFPT